MRFPLLVFNIPYIRAVFKLVFRFSLAQRVFPLLFTPRPLHSAAKVVRTCKFSLEGIQSFAKGEFSMDWMPLLFTAQPFFGWGVKSNAFPISTNLYRWKSPQRSLPGCPHQKNILPLVSPQTDKPLPFLLQDQQSNTPLPQQTGI